jgi:hypothetical protein
MPAIQVTTLPPIGALPPIYVEKQQLRANAGRQQL